MLDKYYNVVIGLPSLDCLASLLYGGFIYL